MGSGEPVPVQVEPVPVHPSSEQPILVQVKAVPVQVVPAAPFFAYFHVVRSRIRIPMSRDPKK